MAKTYRTAQQWNHWLKQFLGHSLLDAEQHLLLQVLEKYYGKHALLIGVPQQRGLLTTTVTSRHNLLTPFAEKNHHIESIESDFYELPITTGSVDLVLLPHALEYIDNPRQLLAEACRIVKPEGHIVILGFNPFSLWGLRKIFSRAHPMPWAMNFISLNKIKKWLGLADFELIRQEMILFRPPLHHPGAYRRLKFLEWLGRKCYKPFGGVYMIVAKAKVISLTPIRLRWQQKLSNAHVTISGPTMRDF